MVETKRKSKCIKLLGSIVIGLAFLCLGIATILKINPLNSALGVASEPIILGYENQLVVKRNSKAD